MMFLPLENWLSPALVRALGYALLHSLWQGAALAGLLAAALPLLRRARPELRYAASAAALAGLLLLAGGTFGYYYSHPPTPQEQRLSGMSLRYQQVVSRWESLQSGQPAPSLNLLPALARQCEPYLPVLVAAWLLGLLLMGGRLAGGLWLASRLRRVAVQAAGAEWQRRLRALAARAGLRHPVALLESARVRGPLVLGHLRPAILLPLGAVAGLPPALLEALLAHELAHIVRRDYLLGLVLAVVEVLFFYHPAAWFMAACLRAERENCCDDRAAQLCGGNRLLVAQALAALAELEAATPAGPHLALAATGTGGRGSLLARVRRLALGQGQAPTLRERLLAGLLCLLGMAGLGTSLALAAPVAASAQQPAPADAAGPRTPAALAPPVAAQPPAPADTIRGRVARRSARAQVLRYGPAPGTIVLEQDKKGRLKNLTVNGQPVPTVESGKKARRNKKAGTVTIIDPAAGNEFGTWQPWPGRAEAWSFPSPGTWSHATPPAQATENQRRARQRLAETLREPDLPADTRLALQEALRQLEANDLTAELPSLSGPPFRLVPSPRYKLVPQHRYQLVPGQLTRIQPWPNGRQYDLSDPEQARQLQGRAQQTQRELAQAQRQLQQSQRDFERQSRDFQHQLQQNRGWLRGGAELSGPAASRPGEARTAQRRAQLEARIAAAEAELQALDAGQEAQAAEQEARAASRAAKAAGQAAKAAPRPPQAPRLPAQTAPPPPPPPAQTAPPPPPAPPVPAPPSLTRAAVRDELRREGLLKPDEKNFDFKIDDDGAKLNGRLLTPAQAEQIRKFIGLSMGSGYHVVSKEK